MLHGGQGGWNIIQHTSGVTRRCFFIGPLGGFVLFPARILRAHGGYHFIAKHMRMAADHFGANCSHNVFELEVPGFLGHTGMIDRLKQQIAQLVFERCHVATRDGISHLIGFLDSVGRDGGKGLLDVPGATNLGRAQPGHDLDQVGDVARAAIGQGVEWQVIVRTIRHVEPFEASRMPQSMLKQHSMK